MIDAFRVLYECRKRPFSWPAAEEWRRAGDLRSLAATFRLDMPLADEEGVSIEGLSLILDFAALAPHDGGAVLRYRRQSSYHLGRFDFGAAERHVNSRAIAAGICGIPRTVDGSHMHPFGINARLGVSAFAATAGCPPGAIVVEDAQPSFRARMRQVGLEFGIEDLDGIPPPPYQGDLWR